MTTFHQRQRHLGFVCTSNIWFTKLHATLCISKLSNRLVIIHFEFSFDREKRNVMVVFSKFKLVFHILLRSQNLTLLHECTSANID